MRTQGEAQTAGVRQRGDADTLPRAGARNTGAWPAPAPKREDDGAAYAAPQPHGPAPGAQPCPERIWWFGVLVGGPLMLIGFLLTLTLFGAPLGIPLWAAGLGLMLSPRPCRD